MCSILGSTEGIFYYWKSLVVDDKTASGLYYLLKSVVDDVHTADTKGLSCFGDNARNIEVSFQMLQSDKPGILFSGCAAHILNQG